MTYFHLSPLLKAHGSLDTFGNIFNHLDSKQAHHPSYNIEKFDDNHFAIVMNVAGFTEQDLDIELEGTVLNVSAVANEKNANSDAEKLYLHQGIFKSDFSRQFNVPDHVNIIGADLNNGLLTITLEREIPEAMKPRKIAINK